MSYARYARVRVMYNGKNITADVSDKILGFTFTDNAAGEMDNIDLTLEDTNLQFMGAWFPGKGAKVKAYIDTFNWNRDGEKLSLYCGSFRIDEVECSFNPNTISMKGVSAPLGTGLKKTKRTKAWVGMKLKDIASQIAASNGLKFYWHSTMNMGAMRYDQRDESDLTFLKRALDVYAHHVKVSEETLVCYFEDDYKLIVPSVAYTPQTIETGSFRDKTDGTYSKAKVRYNNPKTKKTESHEVSDSANTSGQELNVNVRAENKADAENKAKAALKKKNKEGVTCNISCIGNPSLRAAYRLSLSGFGHFNGTYFTDKVTHSLDKSGGYTCSVEAHRP